MQMLVLPVIGGGDFGQKACDHLYDIRNGHFANLVLRPNFVGILTRTPCSARLGEGTRLIICKTLYVREILDLYAARMSGRLIGGRARLGRQLG